jgi:hypothetical protein
VQKIKFVGVVVFEKKRFVDGNASSIAYTYMRPWHKDRRRNSSVLNIKGQISYSIIFENITFTFIQF